MIKEDYVSFETAKLLKERGFDEKTEYIYCYPFHFKKNFRKDTFSIGRKNSDFENEYFETYSAPTLQMTMKWLREVHNLYIEPYVIKNYDNKKLEYTYSIQDLDFNGSDDGIECCKNWNSPEEACEAAIKYCLENLI